MPRAVPVARWGLVLGGHSLGDLPVSCSRFDDLAPKSLCRQAETTEAGCQRWPVITGWKNPDSPGACQQASRSPATKASSVSAARRYAR
jgi:hypothetical protein